MRTEGSYDIGKLTVDRGCERSLCLKNYGVRTPLLQLWEQSKDGVQVKVKSRNFEITIDEPKELGGTNTGMNPVELLLGALGACQSIVARVYADKFNIKLDNFSVELEGDIDLDGFFNKSDVRPGFSDIRYNIHIDTDAPKEKVDEFIAFLASKCPVGDTIENAVNLKLNKVIIGSTVN